MILTTEGPIGYNRVQNRPAGISHNMDTLNRFETDLWSTLIPGILTQMVIILYYVIHMPGKLLNTIQI